MSPAPHDRLSRLEVFGLLALVALARLVASRWIHVYDDAFITFRYARNLAEGAGLTFNPGAPWEPILGTTTPGYAALLAGLLAAGLGAVPAALGLNVLMDVTSAALLIRLVRGSRRLAGLAVVGFALTPELVRISVGCMEAPVLVALVLAACLAARERRPAWAGVAAAVACTVRPEAVLLVPAVLLALPRDRRALTRFAVPVLAVGLLYAGALTAYYGDPIPSSVRSKAERHGGSPLLDTWAEILRQGLLPRPAYVVFLPFLALGLRPALAGALRPLMLFAGAMLAAYLVARPHTWGWYYGVPLTAWVVAVAHGASRALEGRVSEAALGRAFRVGLPLLVVGLGLAGLLVPARDPVTEGVYRPLAAWARAEGTARERPTILASDIGAVGYLTGARILDTEGLTWPGADPSGAQVPIVLEHRPDYVLLTAVQAKARPFLGSAWIRERYEPILRLSSRGATELRPDPDELPDTWVQDYLLYRRSDP